MTKLLQSLPVSLIDWSPTVCLKGCFRSRPWLVALLSAVGVCAGLAPDLSNLSATQWWDAPVYAQSAISNTEVSQFARAAYKIERERQTLYTIAKPVFGGAVPANFCGMNDLPTTLAAPCQTFLVNSDRHIRESGLTAPRFYEIYNRQQFDSDLQARVNKELQLCQQQGVCR